MSTADECAGWLNGTLDTWSDPAEPGVHNSRPGGFTSQDGQDKKLWQTIFSKLERRGTYLDVASNHYKRISNTYFYDVCQSWRGVCVEPNPIYWPDLRTKRTCELIPFCASDNASREVELDLAPFQWLGGMGGADHGSLMRYYYRNRNLSAPVRSKWPMKRMKCVRLADELARLSISRVDLMSLDVEGGEAAVLRGIDFSRVQIDHILCESHCAEVLSPLGYRAMRLRTSADTLWSCNAQCATRLRDMQQ